MLQEAECVSHGKHTHVPQQAFLTIRTGQEGNRVRSLLFKVKTKATLPLLVKAIVKRCSWRKSLEAQPLWVITQRALVHGSGPG